LTEQILGRYQAQVKELSLVPSRGGVFEVQVDGEMLFSKAALHRHADPEEVLAAIASRQPITS
jgi:selenoprotein W-related protein